MGYQALLFCPDEKLASVVTQVFSEVDFTVETAREPFAAVKKLMTQRYDALVVDAENEQNAPLLFKSARNSSFNQSCLAIALVEGQIGVAKAYRIGANLVLTKPINVEQAKGTLRVARGLLRKNADAAAAAGNAAPLAIPPRTAPAFAASSFQPENRSVPAMSAPSSYPDVAEDEPGFAAPGPAPIDEPMADFPEMAAAKVQGDFKPAAATTASARADVTAPAAAPVGTRPAAFTPVAASAAAPAPARQVAAAPASKSNVAQPEPVDVSHDQPHEPVSAPTFGSLSLNASAAPSFAALGGEDSGKSGGSKRLSIAVAAVLAIAVFGYFGYGMLGKSATSTPSSRPVSLPHDSGKPLTPVPMSSPVTEPSKTMPERATSGSPSSASKTTAVATGDPSTGAAVSPVVRIAAEPETHKSESAPLLVKSGPARSRTQAQTEEPSSAPPTPPAVVPVSDSTLNGLVSSISSSLPQPALATIKISQGVSQGLLIKRVAPRYPQAALATHTQGAVQIEATINREGNVVNPKVLKGDPILARAALEAVRQWRYKPYYLDGAPLEIQTEITINFKAD